MLRSLILGGILFFSAQALAHRDLGWRDRDAYQFYCWHALESSGRGRIELIHRPETPSPAPTTWMGKIRSVLGVPSGPTAPTLFDLEYRKQPIQGVEGIYDPGILSYRYFPTVQPERPRVLLTLSHGIGGKDSSHAGATVPWLRTFMGLDKIGKRLYRERIEKSLEPISLVAETMDLPESGNSIAKTSAPRFSDFSSLYETNLRLAEFEGRFQARAQAAKRVWLGMSASCGLVASVNAANPGLLHGQILVGFLHPSIGFKHSYDAFYDESKQRLFEPNWPAFHWVNRMYEAMTWHKTKGDPFSGTPTLIIVGTEDSEVSAEARAYYRDLSGRFSHIRFLEVKGGKHNVLAPTRDFKPDDVYREIFDFLDKI